MSINSSIILRALGLTAIFTATHSFAFRADDAAPPAPARPAISTIVPQKIPAAAQTEAVKALAGAEVEWDAKSGAPASIRAKDLALQNIGGKGLALGRPNDFAANAVAVMDRLTKVFAIRDASAEFAPLKITADKIGGCHVRLNQVYGGLRVVGGQVIVHFDRAGRAYQVNGRYIPDIEIETAALLDEASVVRAAQQDLAAMGKPAGRLKGSVELVVYARNVAPVLAYEFRLGNEAGAAAPEVWRYWINAGDGAVLNRFNDLRKVDAAITGSILTGEGGSAVIVTGNYASTYYYLLNTNRHWQIYNSASTGYVDAGSTAFRPSSNDWSTSDRAEMSAAYNFYKTQLYYLNNYARNSYDGSGTNALAHVHYPGGTDNAYWDPDSQSFYFYPGYYFGELTVMDVCGHEFTHAVTEKTADLVYQNESGALNESFSDIFGTAIEFAFQPDGRSAYPTRVAGYADWLIGEDCSYPLYVALRDMRDPQRYGDPSRYHGTGWYYGSGDNGGVHYNSGVQNHFFYLLSEGGSETNDGIIINNLTGLGVSNAAQVAYRALTVYCTADTDYATVRSAWVSAALDLNTNWVSSVRQAWDGVGVAAYSAPSNLVATYGLTDKVRLTWSAATGASAYLIYRNTLNDATSASLLTSTTALSYDDTAVASGTVYYYWVKASGTSGASDFSTVTYGSTVLNPPAGLAASQGASLDRVQLSWNAASGAAGYIIYRNQANNSNSASDIAHTASLSYEDTSASPGTPYYYWVKAYSVSSTSLFSSGASGYIGLAPPGGVSASAGTYSSGILVSWNAVSGALSYRLWRSTSANLSTAGYLGETADTVFVDSAATPAISYYYWIQARKWSMVGAYSDYASGWRRSMAAGNNARGDMDGDGIMDFAVYQEAAGLWLVRLSGSAYATVSYQLGTTGYTPVACDYDTDGKVDPAVYENATGLWIALLSGSGNAPAYGVLGGVGWTPLSGDFDGDGRADAVVYQEAAGLWRALLSGRNYGLVTAAFGGPGLKAVAADYDGDGKVDPAVYREQSAQNLIYWYLALSGSGYITFTRTTAGTGGQPAPADYDGDGKADLATYTPATGVWNYWSSLSNYSFPITFTLGGAGWTAVPADYDGDGKADIAVYQEAAGQWSFLLSAQNYAAASGELGGPGYQAVGAMR